LLDAGGNVIRSYNMDEQEIRYEFVVNNRIRINSLATESFTANLHADLRNFVNTIQRIDIQSDDEIAAKLIAADPTLAGDSARLASEVARERTRQEQDVQEVMQSRFSNMIQIIDDHKRVMAREHADLGSRMARLDLIENRLMEDELTFTSLLSQNEDTDFMHAIMRLQAAESVYLASLQTGARIIQTTLADFIR